MADITITIPDPQIDRVRNAFAPRVGKDPADVTVEDFRQALIDIVIRIVRAYEQTEAEKAINITDIEVT